MQVWKPTMEPTEELVETGDVGGAEHLSGNEGLGATTLPESTPAQNAAGAEAAGNTTDVIQNDSVENVPKENAGYLRQPVPGEKTLANLLVTAKAPLGSTMYIWGGGWNEEDTAAGEEATSIGVSARWAEFAALQGATYDYNTTRYQIHDGLDCSGYVGWLV